jgi:uncharacterized protein
VLRAQVALGDVVREGQVIGIVGDPLSDNETPITASATGVLIGRLNLPLVHEGDAAFHIARIEEPDAVAQAIERMRERIAAMERGPSGEPPIA